MSNTEILKSLLFKTFYDNDDELFYFFDQLSPIGVDEIIGKWKGDDFKTGHWASEELIRHKWFGKWFKNKLDAIPLVCYNDDGKLYSNRTMSGEASLWMVEFRGEYSATMVYDGVPIFDHFRKVDEKTIMGVMNGKGIDGVPDIVSGGRYYFFYLEKIECFPVEFVVQP